MVLVADDYSIVRAKMVDGEWMVMTMIKMMTMTIKMEPVGGTSLMTC